MKQQFSITHTVHQNEIPALLDSWFTNTSSVKVLCPLKKYVSLYIHKNTTRLCVDLLRISQVSSVSRKIVCGWVTTNFSFMGDIV